MSICYSSVAEEYFRNLLWTGFNETLTTLLYSGKQLLSQVGNYGKGDIHSISNVFLCEGWSEYYSK